MRTNVKRNKWSDRRGAKAILIGFTALVLFGIALISSDSLLIACGATTLSDKLENLAAAGPQESIPDAMPETELSLVVPIIATDVVTEWNQRAAALALLTASNLAANQQLRAIAIAPGAVHDGVNCIRRQD